MINKKLLYASFLILSILLFCILNIASLVSDDYVTGGISFTGYIDLGLKNIKYTSSNTEQKIDNYKCNQTNTFSGIPVELDGTLCQEAKNTIIPMYIFIVLVFLVGCVKTFYISKGRKNKYIDLILPALILSVLVMNTIVVYYFSQIIEEFSFLDPGYGSSLSSTAASMIVGTLIFFGLLIEVFYNFYNKKYN